MGKMLVSTVLGVIYLTKRSKGLHPFEVGNHFLLYFS